MIIEYLHNQTLLHINDIRRKDNFYWPVPLWSGFLVRPHDNRNKVWPKKNEKTTTTEIANRKQKRNLITIL